MALSAKARLQKVAKKTAKRKKQIAKKVHQQRLSQERTVLPAHTHEHDHNHDHGCCDHDH